MPDAEEMIGHAIYAIETIPTWTENTKEASPEQHLAKSESLMNKMRDANVIDVGVLIGKSSYVSLGLADLSAGGKLTA